MKVKTLADVYGEQLQDMHSAEAQLVTALPKMARAAAHAELKGAFTDHLSETREHLRLVGDLLSDIERKPGRRKCAAMQGLVEEGEDTIDEDAEPDARDAGLIVAAQKIEHYEIASYGCLRTFAETLGREHHARIIQRILDQEKKADVLLSTLATSAINVEAMTPE